MLMEHCHTTFIPACIQCIYIYLHCNISPHCHLTFLSYKYQKNAHVTFLITDVCSNDYDAVVLTTLVITGDVCTVYHTV